MAKSKHSAETGCSVAEAAAILSDRWTMLILRNAFHGMKTFDAFRDHLDVSPSVLSDRLSKLLDAGVFERVRSPEDGRSHQYRLTECGYDIYPILIAMMNWGDRWRPGGAGYRMRLIERATGEEIQGVRVLSADGQALHARDIRVELGPGAASTVQDLVARTAKTRKEGA